MLLVAEQINGRATPHRVYAKWFIW